MNKVKLASSHILSSLAVIHHRPLFVAIQGPQGSGKTYLTRLLQKSLSEPPNALRVAVLSIDDLYLPHNALVSLANQYPNNPLWRGRGQPGTHDIQLSVTLLDALQKGSKDIELPRFDKSLFNGEGDRLPMDGSGPIVRPPVDLVILEGWCTGFYPISEEELDKRWDSVWQDAAHALDLHEEHAGTKESIRQINAKLHEYMNLWSFFDVFVQLTPAPAVGKVPYSIIYQWRREQEHEMKAQNGGKGMSDAAVKSFVDRYIPGYVFFNDGVTQGYAVKTAPSPSTPRTADISPGPKPSISAVPPWSNHGLRIAIDERRDVVDVDRF